MNWDLSRWRSRPRRSSRSPRGVTDGRACCSGSARPRSSIPALLLVSRCSCRDCRIASPTARSALLWWSAGTWLAVNLPFAIAAPRRVVGVLPLQRRAHAGLRQPLVHRVPARATRACISTGTSNVASAGAVRRRRSALVCWSKCRRDPAFPRWTLGFPLLVVLPATNKVYSPQYGLWLLPWFALVVPGLRRFVAFEVADVAVFVTRFWFFGDVHRARWRGRSSGGSRSRCWSAPPCSSGAWSAGCATRAPPRRTLGAGAGASAAPRPRDAGARVSGDSETAPRSATAARRALGVPRRARRCCSRLGVAAAASSPCRRASRPTDAGSPTPALDRRVAHAVHGDRAAGRPVVPAPRDDGVPPGDDSAAFFPLYPLTVRARGRVVPAIGPLGAALLVSNVACVRRAARAARPHAARARRPRPRGEPCCSPRCSRLRSSCSRRTPSRCSCCCRSRRSGSRGATGGRWAAVAGARRGADPQRRRPADPRPRGSRRSASGATDGRSLPRLAAAAAVGARTAAVLRVVAARGTATSGRRWTPSAAWRPEARTIPLTVLGRRGQLRLALPDLVAARPARRG